MGKLRLSQRRCAHLYEAISEPITKERMKTSREGETVEEMLFRLEQEIWYKVSRVLEIQ